LVGAHRGAMVYEPENTLRAFQRAVDDGAYRIELDVRLSRDGEVVVIHDETLDRTTNGTGYVRDMTLEHLKRLDAGKGEKIPTLAEALRFAKGRTRLIVEVKEENMAGKVVKAIEDAGMEDAGMEDAVVVSSFIEDAIEQVKQLNPRIATATFQLPGQRVDGRGLAERHIYMVIGDSNEITKEDVEEAHSHGIHVRCGLPDDIGAEQTEREVRRLAALGVDEISSGDPALIAKSLRAKG